MVVTVATGFVNRRGEATGKTSRALGSVVAGGPEFQYSKRTELAAAHMKDIARILRDLIPCISPTSYINIQASSPVSKGKKSKH